MSQRTHVNTTAQKIPSQTQQRVHAVKKPKDGTNPKKPAVAVKKSNRRKSSEPSVESQCLFTASDDEDGPGQIAGGQSDETMPEDDDYSTIQPQSPHTTDAAASNHFLPNEWADDTIPGTDRPAQLRECGIDSNVLDVLVNFDHPDIAPDERTMLKQYRDTGNGGERLVRYAPAFHGYGRYYADRGLSMQSFPRRIRHTLARSLDGTPQMHDIDMKNGNPKLLLQVCKQRGWSAPCLEDYVSNRTARLQEIMGTYQVPQEEAKELFLRLVFGGKFQKWARDNKIGSGTSKTGNARPASNTSPNQFIQDFEKELQMIMENVWNCEDYSDIRALATENAEITENHTESKAISKLVQKNPKARHMSIVIQDIEHQVLMVMESFFVSVGAVIIARCFDGLLIKATRNQALDPNILRQCEAYAKKESGYEIELLEKPMDKAIDLRLLACKTRPQSENTWRHSYIQKLLQCLHGWRFKQEIYWKEIGELLYQAQTSLQTFEDVTKNYCDSASECLGVYKKAALKTMSDAKEDDPAIAVAGIEDDGQELGCAKKQTAKEPNAEHSFAQLTRERERRCVAAIRKLEKLAQRDNPKLYQSLNPMLDLRCPFTIDDLLGARTKDRAAFFIPKVLARLTGTEEERHGSRRHDRTKGQSHSNR